MDLILAIREKYFRQISLGVKKYEYRFTFPVVKEKTKLYLYVSKTKKAIMGYIEISEMQWLSAEAAVKFYVQQNLTDENSEVVMQNWIGEHLGCYALKIDAFHQFEKPLTLEYLKAKYDFNVPQNFVYLKDLSLNQELQSLVNKEKPLLRNL